MWESIWEAGLPSSVKDPYGGSSFINRGFSIFLSAYDPLTLLHRSSVLIGSTHFSGPCSSFLSTVACLLATLESFYTPSLVIPYLVVKSSMATHVKLARG